MTIWAMDETVKIQIRPTKQGDKTETHIPEVDYDKEKNKLDVSFRSDGNYDVIIDDEDGETRCRFGQSNNMHCQTSKKGYTPLPFHRA